MGKMKRYFHKIGGRHSEQLVTPSSILVDGRVIDNPGLSAEFGNHICETDDENLQGLIEKSPMFEAGTIRLLEKDPPPQEGSGPKYATGQATVAELEGKKDKKK